MDVLIRCPCGLYGKVGKQRFGEVMRCPCCRESFAVSRHWVPRFTVIDAPAGNRLTLEVPVQGGKEAVVVRLLGLSLPEDRSPFESEHARQYMEAQLVGCTAWLSFDIRDTDAIGTKLVYVHLDDGSLANERLLREGFVQVDPNYRDIHHFERFHELQSRAVLNRKGMWR